MLSPPPLHDHQHALFVPDTLAAFEWQEENKSCQPPWCKRLHLQVLADAVTEWRLHVARTNSGKLTEGSAAAIHTRNGLNELRRWFHEPGRGEPFQFGTICDLLGIDPGQVRRALGVE